MGFKEGNVPWNKGLQGWTNSGSFKKGHTTNIGKHWEVSIEGRKRMSEGQKGKKSHRRNLSYEEEYGLERAEQIRRKISINQKGHPKSPKAHVFGKGKQNPNWKGGITPYTQKLRNSLRMKQWREAIFERDDYTCQNCGKRGGGYLEAHHLIPFSSLVNTPYESLIFDVNNGKTLCKKCHNLTRLRGAT